MSLTGKNIVVTGGAGGLGLAVVQALVDAGAVCHVPAMSAVPPGFERERVHVTPGVDLSDEPQVSRFYARLPPPWASIHLAGGFAMAPVLETTRELFVAQMTLNATTCFLCCREAVRAMKGGGRIVNVASRAALVPGGGMIAYSTSKAAVAWLTRCLAEEVRDAGILVNAVAPSIIDTPANRKGMPKADFDKWPKPEELARTILFLASPENTLTSGEVVPVYGRA